MRSASIEWLCAHAGILRLHPTADGKLGDPWDWACAIYRCGPGEVILKAAEKAPPEPRTESVAALCRAGVAEGIEWFHWERRGPDGMRPTVRFRTKR